MTTSRSWDGYSCGGKCRYCREKISPEISDCRSHHRFALRFLLRDVLHQASGAAGGNELADLRPVHGPHRRPAGGEPDRRRTVHHPRRDTVVAGGDRHNRPRGGGSARNRRFIDRSTLRPRPLRGLLDRIDHQHHPSSNRHIAAEFSTGRFARGRESRAEGKSGQGRRNPARKPRRFRRNSRPRMFAGRFARRCSS